MAKAKTASNGKGKPAKVATPTNSAKPDKPVKGKGKPDTTIRPDSKGLGLSVAEAAPKVAEIRATLASNPVALTPRQKAALQALAELGGWQARGKPGVPSPLGKAIGKHMGCEPMVKGFAAIFGAYSRPNAIETKAKFGGVQHGAIDGLHTRGLVDFRIANGHSEYSINAKGKAALKAAK